MCAIFLFFYVLQVFCYAKKYMRITINSFIDFVLLHSFGISGNPAHAQHADNGQHAKHFNHGTTKEICASSTRHTRPRA